MIKILEKELMIKTPTQELSIDVKNYLREHLKNGDCIFKTPVTFDSIIFEKKKHKKNYKVGFLYDILTVIYPEYGKEMKHSIISVQYDFGFSYRQFKTILDEYEKDRNKYLLKPNLLK